MRGNGDDDDNGRPVAAQLARGVLIFLGLVISAWIAWWLWFTQGLLPDSLTQLAYSVLCVIVGVVLLLVRGFLRAHRSR